LQRLPRTRNRAQSDGFQLAAFELRIACENAILLVGPAEIVHGEINEKDNSSSHLGTEVKPAQQAAA
jgi:hypothetical protein